MKSKKLKLQLNKETIGQLDTNSMSKIVGGNDLYSQYYPEAIQIATGDEAIANQLTIEYVMDQQGMEAGELAITASISTCHISKFTCCATGTCTHCF